jgi:hypothetical protein
MPAVQAALRSQALVLAVAFPHHPVQEKTAFDPPAEPPGAIQANQNEERCGGE